MNVKYFKSPRALVRENLPEGCFILEPSKPHRFTVCKKKKFLWFLPDMKEVAAFDFEDGGVIIGIENTDYLVEFSVIADKISTELNIDVRIHTL